MDLVFLRTWADWNPFHLPMHQRVPWESRVVAAGSPCPDVRLFHVVKVKRDDEKNPRNEIASRKWQKCH